MIFLAPFLRVIMKQTNGYCDLDLKLVVLHKTSLDNNLWYTCKELAHRPSPLKRFGKQFSWSNGSLGPTNDPRQMLVPVSHCVWDEVG